MKLISILVVGMLSVETINAHSSLRNMVRESLMDDQCNGDEYSMQYAVQRGCRKTGERSSTVCCGSCDRDICKSKVCIACGTPKIDQKDIFSQINITRDENGPQGSWVLPVSNAIDVLHGVIDLGLNAAPFGSVATFFVDTLWPHFQSNTWALVKAQVEALIEKKALGDVEAKLFNKNSAVQYLLRQFAEGGSNLASSYTSLTGEFHDIYTSLTSDIGDISKIGGFPLAVIVATMHLIFQRSAVDKFMLLNLPDMANKAKFELESKMMDFTQDLVSFAVAQYKDWYQSHFLVHKTKDLDWGDLQDHQESFEWKDGKLFFRSGQSHLHSADAIKEYILTSMYNHVVRLLAPFALMGTIIDKSFPAVFPAIPNSGLTPNLHVGPFHPWMRSNEGKCCTTNNPFTSMPHSFKAVVNKDIDGLLLNDINAGSKDCLDDKPNCFSYNVHGDVLSVYIKSNSNYITGLVFHTETDQTFVAGQDHSDFQFVVVQSPFSGLTSDRFRINLVQTEKNTARHLKFTYKWSGDKVKPSQIQNPPNYGSYATSGFAGFLEDVYLNAMQLDI